MSLPVDRPNAKKLECQLLMPKKNNKYIIKAPHCKTKEVHKLEIRLGSEERLVELGREGNREYARTIRKTVTKQKKRHLECSGRQGGLL